MIAFMLSYHVYRRYGLLLPCTDVFIDDATLFSYSKLQAFNVSG